MASERASASSAALRLPADARIVALLASVPENSGLPEDTQSAVGQELKEAAVEVAARLSRHRGRTLLSGIGAPGRVLDKGLGRSGAPGLSDALAGRVRLVDVAQPFSDVRFLHVPVGLASRPSPTRLRLLLDRIRAADGALLLVLPADRAGFPAQWFDAELELDTAGGLPRPVSQALLAESWPSPAARTEPIGQWRRHRTRPAVPVARIASAAAALMLLLGGWYLLARIVATRTAGDAMQGIAAVASGEPAGEPSAVAGARAAEGDATGETGAPTEESDSPAEAEESEQLASTGEVLTGEEAGRSTTGIGTDELYERPEDGPARVDASRAPRLTYSVLIASYAALEDAVRRAQRAADSSLLLFVAPTPIRGKLYYRLFAGALETREAAEELMRELVDRGVKEAVGGWDVRPAELGFLVSVHADSSSAGAERLELAAAGIPAYLIPLVAVGDTAYQVYAGAYERPEAAAAMQALLTDVGRNVKLVPRLGEPR